MSSSSTASKQASNTNACLENVKCAAAGSDQKVLHALVPHHLIHFGLKLLLFNDFPGFEIENAHHIFLRSTNGGNTQTDRPTDRRTDRQTAISATPLCEHRTKQRTNANKHTTPSHSPTHTLLPTAMYAASGLHVRLMFWPLVATLCAGLPERASHNRTVLSIEAVASRSGLCGDQQSWSTRSVWPFNSISADC